MIKLRDDIYLPVEIETALAKLQAEIDSLPTFPEKSEKAKRLFSSKNRKKNATFTKLKELLSAMCNSTRRCVYCEDSLADEVEHIYPKDLFPEKCFEWGNYVYACGPCNGPKNNYFAVYEKGTGNFVDLNGDPEWSKTGPPPGTAVLINPRQDDPLEFCMLDLSGTFKFVPLPRLGKKKKERVEYTYDRILRLNAAEREPVRQARENAYDNFKCRLKYYVHLKTDGAAKSRLDKAITGIQSECHITVWREMQRYHSLGLLRAVDQELDRLFRKAPEALTW